MKPYFLILIFILFFHLNSIAQSTFGLGLLPTLNINKKLPEDWSLNFKTESRQALINEEFDYAYLLTDISLAAAKKIGINTAVAMGYLMRIVEEDNGIQNRTMQQITFIKRYSNFMLSHRILADQTFQKDDYTELRIRYRITMEHPLQGKTSDPGEFFLKLNNEYLNSLYNKTYDLEIRGAAFLGYELSPNNKLELGFDYRIDSFISGMPRNRLWIGLNFYQSL